MKKIIATVLAFVIVIGSVMFAVPEGGLYIGLTTAFAAETVASGTCGDNLTWTLDAEGTLTISGSGAMWDWNNDDNPAPWSDVISQINNVVIDGATSIGNTAFIWSGIKNITISESVVSIGNGAFYCCWSLEEITIPKSVVSIGENSFGNCSALTQIYVDADNPAYISENGVLFNIDKTRLLRYPSAKAGDNYNIPDTVESIAAYAFNDCYALQSVYIPNSVTSIGEYAFTSCFSLTDINIPDSVTSIDEWAFSGCGIKQAIIPDGITVIPTGAFSGCSSLESINIPDSVKNIEEYAFAGSSSLTEINVSSGNTAYIAENNILFNADKTELLRYACGKPEESYTVPDSVVTIGSYAFDECNTNLILKSSRLSNFEK